MWGALLDLSERLDDRWALVGGQMVALHALSRGADMGRVTTDVDALLDVTMDSTLFRRVDSILRSEMGFVSNVGIGGTQHRWTRDGVQIDILIPGVSRSIGESKSGIGGVAVQSPGANQALRRAEPVRLRLGQRVGRILVPNLQGAIISKAAAYGVPTQRARARHLIDLSVLLSVAGAGDRIYEGLTRSDLRHLRRVQTMLSQRSTVDVEDLSVDQISQYLTTALSSAVGSGAPITPTRSPVLCRDCPKCVRSPFKPREVMPVRFVV